MAFSTWSFEASESCCAFSARRKKNSQDLKSAGIAAFIEREVLPHARDAWVDETATKVGYEISFTRYFYQSLALRSLEEIRADILALERETDGLLHAILDAVPGGTTATPAGRGGEER